MKTILTTLIAFLVIGNSVYAETEKKVKSKIEGVTVYLQGAQIVRKGSFQIQKGVTKVIFEGMTQQFDKNNIQVKGKGNFVILDVSTNIFYPQPKLVVATTIPEKILREISLLTDSIDDKNWILQELRSQIDAFKNEREILMTSGVIKGQNQNDSLIENLKEAMEFLRLKLNEINKHILVTERKFQREQSNVNRMNARLSELSNYNQKAGNTSIPQLPVQQIIVTVSADQDTYGSLEMKYMVQGAGWSPAYDLRADDVNSPVKLTYKAKVYQNTGVNWENVNVTLSTTNPNQSNYKPTLAPWYINYYQPIQHYDDYGRGKPSYKRDEGEMLDMELSMPVTASNSIEEVDAKHIANYTQMSENIAMVEFELKIPYTIESDGKEHLMAVANEEIEASYQHYIVPKLDKDAFLVAQLTNWEELNLLPAVANIYYDGTYVGQTRINPSVMSDTLELAFGRDKGIYLTRKKTNDEEKIKKLTGEKEKTITYQLALKNYKSSEINIIIEDQIPVSLNEEIKVELVEKGLAEFNEKTGSLTWKVDINAKETKKFDFTYLLRYDKDKTLALN